MLEEERTSRTYVQSAIKKQLDYLISNRTVKSIFFTHRQADPDALCAAGALILLLQSSYPEISLECTIVAPQGVSNLGKNVSSTLGIQFQERIEKSLVLESDSNYHSRRRRLSPVGAIHRSDNSSSARKILVDHHFSSLDDEAWAYLSDRIVRSDSTSTCEIIALGFPSHLITKKIGDILLTGLLFDSQHLGIATEKTLEAALTLVKAGSEISASKKILQV